MLAVCSDECRRWNVCTYLFLAAQDIKYSAPFAYCIRMTLCHIVITTDAFDLTSTQ